MPALRFTRRNWISPSLCVLLLAGCLGGSEQSASRPGTVPVSGTVTYKGQPVPDAHVSLIPNGGETGAFGKTDAQGKFALQSFAPGDGAVPGAYTVTVTARVVTGGVNTSQDIAAPPPPVQEKWLAPQKYADPQTSGLTASVKPDGDNTLKLELAD